VDAQEERGHRTVLTIRVGGIDLLLQGSGPQQTTISIEMLALGVRFWTIESSNAAATTGLVPLASPRLVPSRGARVAGSGLVFEAFCPWESLDAKQTALSLVNLVDFDRRGLIVDYYWLHAGGCRLYVGKSIGPLFKEGSVAKGG